MKNPRLIKFRAWRTDPAGSWMDNGEFYVGEDGLVYEHARRTYDTPNTEIEKIETQPILMQFTGLKDKNGKEIWEGDIIRMQQIQGICEFIGVIHIGADPARPYDCRVWVDTSHEEKARKHGIGGKYVFIHNEPEVIGNVYENPELLDVPTVDKSS